MVSPMQTCLSTCLLVFLLQPTGAMARKVTTETLSAVPQQETGKQVVEKTTNDLEEFLKGGCSCKGRTHLSPRWNLEKSLQTAGIPEKNISVVHSLVQSFIFKIQPQTFQGLNTSSEALTFPSSGKNRTRHSMHFPAALVERLKDMQMEESRITCIYLKASCIFQDGKNSSLLNDDILGATLGNASVTNLSQPVEIRFWHHDVLGDSNATCVFWVEATEDDGMGHWSRDDCNTTHHESLVLCQCYHLTYFAVLLQISPDGLDKNLLAPLTYISIVGCSISAAVSLLTIFLYLVSRKRQNDSTIKVHMNVLGALFLLNGSFLLSEPLASVGSMWICRAAAASLHYSLLCTLTWMAIEGFHLYRLLIRVYNLYIQNYLLKLGALGWGLPAVAVASILLIDKGVYGIHNIQTGSDYSNATMCWITSRGIHNILNLGYAGATILFNIVVLVTVLRLLRTLRFSRSHQDQHARKDMMTVLGLTCLLGLTWALAFLSFGVFLIPQLFLFTILNSLQGFFIGLWYCTSRLQSVTSISSRTSQTTK
uniref:Adhesion G protein-coupled receptor G5 n=2 Tax=Sphenodon punctatus TaxID=8508 RepID=A0A8D0GT44_SPHPU